LEAANLSARTTRAYTEDGALFARFLGTADADEGRLHPARARRGVHRCRARAHRTIVGRHPLPVAAAVLALLREEGEIDASPMAQMRSPIIPRATGTGAA
jgi:hypothetical protein